MKKIAVAITGASGSIYAKLLLQKLSQLKEQVQELSIVWHYIFPTGFDFADMSMISYFQLWLTAVLAESFFLKMFYRRKSWNQIIITSVVMNVVAYAILYVVFVYINS